MPPDPAGRKSSIKYAEREPATSRERPMVLFALRPTRANWLSALPGAKICLKIIVAYFVMWWYNIEYERF